MSASLSVSFRQADECDIDFLRALRSSTMREVVLRHHAWHEEEQNQRVLVSFDSARVILKDGDAIGLLKVVRESHHFHLIQIQLLPAFQGRGIGTAVITALQEECSALDLPIVLRAYASNRALALYSRLGFEIVDRSGHAYTMRWEQRRKEPNQTPEPTAPSGRGSS